MRPSLPPTSLPALSSVLDPASPDAYGRAFRAGLCGLLAAGQDLGLHILVLANAAYDPALWDELSGRLAENHDRLSRWVTHALREGNPIAAPEDDLQVFLRLMAMGFPHVGQREQRHLSFWEVQYNPVRALRPARMSTHPSGSLMQPFDASGFHFNLPFLARERIATGPLLGVDADLLYNKFPFAQRHALLVPERERAWPQYLTPAWHDHAWRLMDSLGGGMPGMGLAYNSQGAHASVNHLHFQLFHRDEPLPVERPEFQHNGGDLTYPAECHLCRDPLEAWWRIDELHARQCPYNLIYRPGRLFLLPRLGQGRYPTPDWGSGLAWLEMAGVASVFRRDDFQRLCAHDLEAALAATHFP